MKQYTDKDQTAKLIELGFPKPKGWGNKDISNGMSIALYNDGREDFNYSIGELIEFLNDDLFRIDKAYEWYADVGQWSFAAQELIDVLFKACVTLKKEGVI